MVDFETLKEKLINPEISLDTLELTEEMGADMFGFLVQDHEGKIQQLVDKNPEKVEGMLMFINDVLAGFLSPELMKRRTETGERIASLTKGDIHYHKQLSLLSNIRDLRALVEHTQANNEAAKYLDEFSGVLNQIENRIFDEMLQALYDARSLEDYQVLWSRASKMANTFELPGMVQKLSQMRQPRYLAQCMEKEGYGTNTELKELAFSTQLMVTLQKDPLETVLLKQLINEIESLDPLTRKVTLNQLAEYYKRHPNEYMDESLMELIIHKSIPVEASAEQKVPPELINFVKVNIDNKKRSLDQLGQANEGAEVPYINVYSQFLNLFDQIIDPESIPQYVEGHMAPLNEKREAEYYLNESHWNGLLIGGGKKQLKKFEKAIFKYITDSDQIDSIEKASSLALKIQTLLDRYEDPPLPNKDQLEKIRNRVLVHAALGEDKYAIGNLDKLPENKRKLVEEALERLDKIDDEKSRMYDALNAKGFDRFDHIGMGSRTTIEQDITDLRGAKANIRNAAKDMINSGREIKDDEMKTQFDQATGPVLRNLNEKRKGSSRLKIALQVLFPPLALVNAIHKGIRNLRKRILNFVFGRGTIRMTGYKNWKRDYSAVTDHFNGNPKKLNDLKAKAQKDLEEVRLDKEKLSKEKLANAKEIIRISRDECRDTDEYKALRDNPNRNEQEETRFNEIKPPYEKVAELEKRNEEIAAEQEKPSKKEIIAQKTLDYVESIENKKRKAPWLTVRDTRVETEDGKYCDVLHVKNGKNSPKDPKEKKYMVFFSGAEVTYYLDSRHFDYAASLGVDVLAVQHRGLTSNSKENNMRLTDVENDGYAVIKDLIAKGVDPKNISILGYCGGSPSAALAQKKTKEELGVDVALVLDRTYASVSEIAKDKVDKFTQTPAGSRVPSGLGQAVASLGIRAAGCDFDVGSHVENLPDDKFFFYNIMPEERFLNPTDDSPEFGTDRTIPFERSLGKSLEKRKAKYKSMIHKFNQDIQEVAAALGIDLNNPAQDRTPEQDTIFRSYLMIQSISKILEEYIADIGNVQGGVGTELHIADIRRFEFYNKESLDDGLRNFIHNSNEEGTHFRGGYVRKEIKDKDPKLAKHLEQLLKDGRDLGSLLEPLNARLNELYPGANLDFITWINLALDMSLEQAHVLTNPDDKTISTPVLSQLTPTATVEKYDKEGLDAYQDILSAKQDDLRWTPEIVISINAFEKRFMKMDQGLLVQLVEQGYDNTHPIYQEAAQNLHDLRMQLGQVGAAYAEDRNIQKYRDNVKLIRSQASALFKKISSLELEPNPELNEKKMNVEATSRKRQTQSLLTTTKSAAQIGYEAYQAMLEMNPTSMSESQRELYESVIKLEAWLQNINESLRSALQKNELLMEPDTLKACSLLKKCMDLVRAEVGDIIDSDFNEDQPHMWKQNMMVVINKLPERFKHFASMELEGKSVQLEQLSQQQVRTSLKEVRSAINVTSAAQTEVDAFMKSSKDIALHSQATQTFGVQNPTAEAPKGPTDFLKEHYGLSQVEKLDGDKGYAVTLDDEQKAIAFQNEFVNAKREGNKVYLKAADIEVKQEAISLRSSGARQKH